MLDIFYSSIDKVFFIIRKKIEIKNFVFTGSSSNKEKMDVSQKDSSSSNSTSKGCSSVTKSNNQEIVSSNSSHGDSCNNPLTSGSSQPVDNKKESLTEDDIVQVLMECDLLVEGQKRKNRENAGESHKDNKFIENSGADNKSHSEKLDIDVTKVEMENSSVPKTSKSLSEPVSLLACLDAIDK